MRNFFVGDSFTSSSQNRSEKIPLSPSHEHLSPSHEHRRKAFCSHPRSMLRTLSLLAPQPREYKQSKLFLLIHPLSIGYNARMHVPPQSLDLRSSLARPPIRASSLAPKPLLDHSSHHPTISSMLYYLFARSSQSNKVDQIHVAWLLLHSMTWGPKGPRIALSGRQGGSTKE